MRAGSWTNMPQPMGLIILPCSIWTPGEQAHSTLSPTWLYLANVYKYINFLSIFHEIHKYCILIYDLLLSIYNLNDLRTLLRRYLKVLYFERKNAFSTEYCRIKYFLTKNSFLKLHWRSWNFDLKALHSTFIGSQIIYNGTFKFLNMSKLLKKKFKVK